MYYVNQSNQVYELSLGPRGIWRINPVGEMFAWTIDQESKLAAICWSEGIDSNKQLILRVYAQGTSTAPTSCLPCEVNTIHARTQRPALPGSRHMPALSTPCAERHGCAA